MMSVDKRYVEFAIVLAANSNNPTILNPDFLKYNKIIDNAFELRQSPICTEPFAQLSYKNGLTITSQLDKIIFSKKGEGLDNEELSGIAKKYTELVPHVEYTGIGINPTFIIKFYDDVNPEEYVLNNFLKINEDNVKILDAGLSLVLSIEKDITCNIRIESGKIVDDGKKHGIIAVNANFHHNLKYDIENKIKTIHKAIELYKSDIVFFEDNVIKVYFKEDE